MDLNRINIVARQRTPWEALDLGILLARKWYRPLLLSWMLPSAVVFVVMSVLFYDSLWIGLTITWWLKPIWDRVPLMMASRALFGEEMNVRRALRALPSLAKKEWFSWLTWRRLSPTRSFDMPVTVLEALKGDTRRKRLNVLRLNSGGPAAWLTIICVHIEFALVLGAIGLIFLFIPEEIDVNFMAFFESEAKFSEILYNLMTYLAMALVAPFYVLAGFTLYISRRITLEGWDIEIRFRHLAERVSKQRITTKGGPHRQAQSAAMKLGLLLAVIFPVLLFSAGPSHAAIPPSDTVQQSALSPEAQAASKEIAEILAGKDFNREAIKKRWRFRNAEDMTEDEDVPEWLIRLVEFLEKYITDYPKNEATSGNSIGLFIAKALEFLLWVAGISLILLLIYHYRDYLRAFASGATTSKPAAPQTPQVLFGLDVSKESVPDNVPEQVLALWRKGATREALGLLYRATLSRLIHQYHFKFAESATELECAAIVRDSGMPVLDNYLQGLTKIWQRLAYGHRTPDELVVIDFCQRWPEMFIANSTPKNASEGAHEN